MYIRLIYIIYKAFIYTHRGFKLISMYVFGRLLPPFFLDLHRISQFYITFASVKQDKARTFKTL